MKFLWLNIFNIFHDHNSIWFDILLKTFSACGWVNDFINRVPPWRTERNMILKSKHRPLLAHFVVVVRTCKVSQVYDCSATRTFINILYNLTTPHGEIRIPKLVEQSRNTNRKLTHDTGADFQSTRIVAPLKRNHSGSNTRRKPFGVRNNAFSSKNVQNTRACDDWFCHYLFCGPGWVEATGVTRMYNHAPGKLQLWRSTEKDQGGRGLWRGENEDGEGDSNHWRWLSIMSSSTLRGHTHKDANAFPLQVPSE